MTPASTRRTAHPRLVTSPFLRRDSLHPYDRLTDTAVLVLAERGLDTFSVGALARKMRITPAAILKVRSRSEVVEIVVARFAGRWQFWARPYDRDPIPAPLPRTEDERHGVRVWAALSELARGEELAGHRVPAEYIRDARRAELELLAADLGRRIGRPPTAAEVATTAALADGLRTSLARGDQGLDVDQATEVLRHHVQCLAQPD